MKKFLSIALAASMVASLGIGFASAAEEAPAGINATYYNLPGYVGDILTEDGYGARCGYEGNKQFDATIDKLLNASAVTETKEHVTSVNARNWDYYVIKWTGTLTAKESGTYTLIGRKIDNGFAMKVDGKKVYEYWGASHWFDGGNDRLVSDNGSFTVEAGKSYPVEMYFLELGGGDALEIFATTNPGDTNSGSNINDAFTFDLTEEIYRGGNEATSAIIGTGTGDRGAGNGGNSGQCVEDNFRYLASMDKLLAKMNKGETKVVNTFAEAVVNRDSYIVTYNGTMTPKTTGDYTFGAYDVDNGFYLNIEGTVAYEFWAGGTWNDGGDNHGNTYTETVHLEAGKSYNYVAAFIEIDGGQVLSMNAKIGDGETKSLPDLFTFSTAFAGWEEIRSAEGFAKIESNLSGAYMLMTDITLTEGLSAGREGNVFSGSFDGNGHTITVDFKDTNARTGVFCTAGGNNCAIKNLTVNGNITSNGNSCGGVVGTAKGQITFENVTSNVTIVAKGDSEGSCGNGGFLGANEGCTIIFKNCVSNADVTGVRSAAGFIGLVRNGGAKEVFEDCTFNGSARCTTEWSDKRAAGGFIGIMHLGTGDEVEVSFKNCASNGTVIGDYVLASAWVGSYARFGHPDSLPTFENCTQTAKVTINGIEISKINDTRYPEAMDSQSSGKLSFNADEKTVTAGTNMAMNAETLAAAIAEGYKVYVNGVLDETAVVTSDARVLKVVCNDPTVTEGELISVIVIFNNGHFATLGQSSEATRSEDRVVTFTATGANANSTDPAKNLNASGEEPPKTDPPKTDPPKTEPPKTESPKTEPPKTESPKTEPPKTGSAAVVIAAVAVVSLAGVVVASKKREQD